MHHPTTRTLGVLAVVLSLTSASYAQKMERGSFLRKPINSRTQLINQYRSDPIVAARYQRHFGMNDKQIVRYFGTLRQSTIPETRRYTVWHVEPNGTIQSRELMLRQGTPVYVDGSGRIAMKINCGNPMVTGEYARNQVPEEIVAKPPVQEETTTVVEAPQVVEPEPDVVAVVPPPVIEPPVVVPPPVVPPAVIPPVVVAPPVTSAPQIISPSGGGGGLGLLPLLLIPAGAVALAGGGGGGGAPVPEPATMMVLAAGAGMVMANRRRAKK